MSKHAPVSPGDEDNIGGPSHRPSLSSHLTYTVGKDALTATARDWYSATAYATRDHLIGRWMETRGRIIDRYELMYGAAASGGASFTAAPGRSFWMPSTTTRSPAIRPLRISAFPGNR